MQYPSSPPFQTVTVSQTCVALGQRTRFWVSQRTPAVTPKTSKKPAWLWAL